MSITATLQTYLGRPLLSANERVWSCLPAWLTATRPIRAYGVALHSQIERRSERKQYHGTFFLRNRPEMELIRTLADQRAKGSTLRLSVLACSNGAEVYSILWTIRSARPDLTLLVHAIDISKEIVQIAEEGVYSLEVDKLIDAPIFERLTDAETRAMFERHGNLLRIKSWIKEGVDWRVGDASDPELAAQLAPQDIVVANRFLCHMAAADAERCLRSLARLVVPGGYLFVSGVDLDVRTRVARDLGWKPVRHLLEEIHDGDPSVRRDWPWRYWGLEPLSRTRHDWTTRYAAVFQVGAQA
jgi:chemotaxis methyl-accepting protein methylase